MYIFAYQNIFKELKTTPADSWKKIGKETNSIELNSIASSNHFILFLQNQTLKIVVGRYTKCKCNYLPLVLSGW